MLFVAQLSVTVTDRLKQFIVAAFGGSASKAAGAMGIARTTIYQYLRGESLPGRIQLERLEAIGCSSSWLLTGEGEMFSGSDAGMELRRKSSAGWDIAGDVSSEHERWARGHVVRKEMSEPKAVLKGGRLHSLAKPKSRTTERGRPPAFYDIRELEPEGVIRGPVGKTLIPIMMESVHGGPPMPADNTVDKWVDVDAWLVPHPRSTLVVRAVGTSMHYDMIVEGDYVFVDRSLPVNSGSIVVASYEGRLTIKRYKRRRDGIWLMPANPKHKAIHVPDELELKIWGVVTQAVHCLTEFRK